MKRIGIDSMIVDQIMETPGLLESIQRAAGSRRLTFIATHILHDQLAATQDPERREKLLATLEALPKENIPTRGFVLDISRLDEARLGDGIESGVSLGQVKTGGRGGRQDALVATTAAGDADLLVTEDETLAKKVRTVGANCEVWNFAKFVEFVKAESAP